jgi:hypothetical protein
MCISGHPFWMSFLFFPFFFKNKSTHFVGAFYGIHFAFSFYSFLKAPIIARTSPPKNFGSLIV